MIAPDLATYEGHIVPMMLYRMKVELQETLVQDVPEDDPARALVVEVGRFQENPIKENVYIALSGGNPIDPDHLDGRIDNDRLDDIEIPNLPVGEIGGGTYWWRRGTAEIGTYFIKNNFEEERAMMHAYDFYGRLLKTIEQIDLSGLVDVHGERSSRPPHVEGSTFYGKGGAKQHIWRGTVFWRVLTWRP
jgi:hypothetical protein